MHGGPAWASYDLGQVSSSERSQQQPSQRSHRNGELQLICHRDSHISLCLDSSNPSCGHTVCKNRAAQALGHSLSISGVPPGQLSLLSLLFSIPCRPYSGLVRCLAGLVVAEKENLYTTLDGLLPSPACCLLWAVGQISHPGPTPNGCRGGSDPGAPVGGPLSHIQSPSHRRAAPPSWWC